MINLQVGQQVNTAHGKGLVVGYEKFLPAGGSLIVHNPITDWEQNKEVSRAVLTLQDGHTWGINNEYYCIWLSDYKLHN